MAERRIPQIAVDADLHRHRTGAGDIAQRPSRHDANDIDDDEPRQRVRRMLSDEMVQRIAFHQRDDDIPHRAHDAADDHQNHRRAVRLHKRNQLAYPEERQLLVFFHLLFHTAALPSRPVWAS